jgi:hypothetical protein
MMDKCWIVIVAAWCLYYAPTSGQPTQEPARAPAAAKSGGTALRAAPPAEQLKALVADYEAALRAFEKATSGGFLKTPPDQYKDAKEKLLRDVENCTAACVELADKHPEDPAALDALFWVVSHTTVVRVPDNIRLALDHIRALKLLQRDHLHSNKLGPFCRWLAVYWDEDGSSLAERILAENPIGRCRLKHY